MKLESKIDVAVLLIFFNRPNVFKKVFEQVKLVRPSKLFLYQDGAREGRDDDIINVNACRKIAEDINWHCEIYKLYQQKNYGCDPSGYIAHKWAFSIVDKCVVIEDDVVPSQSFFMFCKEMLDKYEYDTRVCRICGMNHLENYTPYNASYFFSLGGSVWGWASWKRVIDLWDPNYKFMSDKNILNTLKYSYKGRSMDIKKFFKICKKHNDSGREHFESIFMSYRYLYSGLNIIPEKNLISNIGITEDATHASGNIKLYPKGLQRVFNMKTYELDFPLNHPDYIFDDNIYTKRLNKIMGTKVPLIRIYRLFERIFRRILFKYLIKN